MIAKRRLLLIVAAILMVFAMMPMTVGTVFAEADVDTEPPVIDLDSLRVTYPDGKDKATIGDTVTLSMEVSDDRGVKSIYLELIKPMTGHSQMVYFDYQGDDTETQNGLWAATFTVDDGTENGIWKTNQIWAYDTTGNGSGYYDSAMNPGMGPAADLSALRFEVYGTSSDPDITKPVIDLDSLSVSLPDGKDKATIGDTVTLSVEVSDDRGVKSIYLELIKPKTGHGQMVYLAYQGDDAETKNGLWAATFTVDDGTENGIWKTNQIWANDTTGNGCGYYDSAMNPGMGPAADLSALRFEVIAPDCPLDLTTEGYSMMLDGAGATTTFGGSYYVNSAEDTVTPTIKVRFDAEDGTWTTLAPRKYTLKYEKETGEGSWEDYTGDTFGVDESGTATYRVSATGKESLHYTGSIGPVEFNVIKKHKVTFDTCGGSNIAPQYVIPGEKATEPQAPAKDDHAFGGWYTDEALTKPYDFGTAVNEDITLYAKWTELEVHEWENGFTWTLSEAGVLTIRGAGDMPDSIYDGSPFYANNNFTKVIIEDGITSVGEFTFCNRRKIECVEFPDSIERIGQSAFQSCSSLTNINLPEGLIKIANDAFSSCNELQGIDIPSGVTEIGNAAFCECANLTHIEIPAGVSSIEYLTFYGCCRLTSITVDPANTVYDSRDNCNAIIETSSNTLIVGCAATVIPASVTAIAREAFSAPLEYNTIYYRKNHEWPEYPRLTEVNIPEGVTYIGDWAFAERHFLETISIPDTVQEIKRGALKDCTSLESVTIPEDITVIEDETFYGCTALKDFVIPEGVTSIGEKAFYQCESLTDITLPAGLKTLGADTFYGCKALTTINIPDSITSIGNNAFRNAGADTDAGSIQINYEGSKSQWAAIEGSENAPAPVAYGLLDVTFEDAGDTPAQTVKAGEKVTRPDDPVSTEEGREFAGWYPDAECTVPFDFDQPIREDTVIYAKWINWISLTVGVYDKTNSKSGQGGTYTFNNEDMTHTIAKHTVPLGNEVTLVAAPADGYRFEGWTLGRVTADGWTSCQYGSIDEV